MPHGADTGRHGHPQATEALNVGKIFNNAIDFVTHSGGGDPSNAGAPTHTVTPKLEWHTVTASVFGGPNDTTPKPDTGYRGDRLEQLNHGYNFAELNMGTAMGGLKLHEKIIVRNKHNPKQQAVLVKGDIGGGGKGMNGTIRAIDIYYRAAPAVGVNGLALVEWAKAPDDAQTVLGPAQGNAVDAAGGAIGSIGDVFSFLFSRRGILTVGAVIFGGMLVALGVMLIGKGILESPTGQAAMSTVEKVAK